jgi:rubrerythrin
MLGREVDTLQPNQTKEVKMLQDALAWEQLEVKKYGLLAAQAADARLRQVAADIQRVENHHVQMVQDKLHSLQQA